jgi:hypothetical protein
MPDQDTSDCREEIIDDLIEQLDTMEESLGPWRRVPETDDDWQCIECKYYVSCGIYPGGWGHKADCKWNVVGPIIKRAEESEKQRDEWADMFRVAALDRDNAIREIKSLEKQLIVAEECPNNRQRSCICVYCKLEAAEKHNEILSKANSGYIATIQAVSELERYEIRGTVDDDFNGLWVADHELTKALENKDAVL